MKVIVVEPLTREAFSPFGEVIDVKGAHHHLVNGGRCQRYDALARTDVRGDGARAIISVMRSQPCELPLELKMMERHPLGSQAMFPLTPRPFLVVVAPGEGDRPGPPRAFLTSPGQGINYPAGRWHGVLTPLEERQDFLVIDRAGEGNNVEEFHFEDPYEIRLSV